tara:strand:- start:458 stop:1564 length:1107 start_codon:yes stop_codon:yes gene_type:complete
MNQTIFFLLNLLQDFYIIRKLIYLFNDDTKYNIELLITKGFLKRDKDLNLSNEIDQIKKDINIKTYTIDSKIKLFNKFNNVKKGILISSSESTLEAHNETSSIMRICRSNITSITLQHGFECVGFLHNQNHSFHHGSYIGFNADIVCGWLEKRYQRDLINSSKSRYCELGHPAFIDKTSKRNLNINFKKNNNKEKPGLFCENIHSARFLNSNSAQDQFLKDFLSLANLLDEEGKKIVIRPHPAGRFKNSITKKPIKLPKNVRIESSPSHKVDWSSFSYGISAPSSVIFDMYLSGVPVCLWSDVNQNVDISLLNSFPIATSVDELFSFCLYHDNVPKNIQNDQIKSMIDIINKGNIGEKYVALIDSILC